MKTASLLRRLEALERRLSSVEQERITVVIERRDPETGEGGPDTIVIISPGHKSTAIQRYENESHEQFAFRAGIF